MLCYKMTDGDLCCRGVQLRLGKQHIESAADCAARGWHAATDPLCCLTYYSDEKRSRFLLCDAGGDIDEDGSDEKLSCTELTVLRELAEQVGREGDKEKEAWLIDCVKALFEELAREW